MFLIPLKVFKIFSTMCIVFPRFVLTHCLYTQLRSSYLFFQLCTFSKFCNLNFIQTKTVTSYFNSIVPSLVSLTVFVATLDPGSTRLVSLNRKHRRRTFNSFYLHFITFSFSKKCLHPNPRSDPNGGSEPEPGLLRSFYLSYRKIFINSFSCGSDIRSGQGHNHLQIQSNSIGP